MERKITKKLLAMLMVITILATDFLVLGSNLVTYATQINNDTTNPNIKFSTYFKDGKNKVDSIEQSIKSSNLKLYAELTVNGEDGYLEKDATIEVQNSNFTIISTNKGTLEGNKVVLNQINAGETVEIELGIEPIILEKMPQDFLSKKSTVKLIGSYKYSEAEKGTIIEAEKTVCVNYKPEEAKAADISSQTEEVQAELTSEIITNKVFDINGTNKRIIQVLVKSRLSENQYPVKQTILNVSVPKLNVTDPETQEVTATSPEVDVLAIGQLATNGATKINNSDYSFDGQNLQITLKNEADSAGEINWIKNAYDELVVTMIYPGAADASEVEITTNSEITVHGAANTYTAQYTKGIKNQELNQAIIGRTEITTEELYKGQLYANAVSENDVNVEYEIKTTLVVTNKNIAEKITITEGNDVFGTADAELAANTQYMSTKINKQKMLDVLGEFGNIEIKNGQKTTLINKDSEVNENGEVVIEHGENSASELEITTSNQAAAGVIEIYHTKAITGDNYTRDQIKTVKTLKAKGNIVGTVSVNKEEQTIVKNSTETTASSLELKETKTKAELTIDKTTLSTTVANQVTVGIKLNTEGMEYDLFKKTTIVLQMPSVVESVEFIEEPTKLNDEDNELGAIDKNYDVTSKKLTIQMDGEQKLYPKTSIYIQLKLKLKLDSLALTQKDKITMTYTNANASQYEGGKNVIEQAIEISAPSQLIKTFNIKSNEDTTSEDILHTVKANETIDFEIGLRNNKDTNISDVKILGKLPTTKNIIADEENALETTLKSVTAENAKIYYTENAEATEDVENTTNGWTEELTTNAKMYLIKLDSLERGANYTAKVSIQIPETIEESELSYTQYEVIYDAGTATSVKENSRKIGLITSVAASIKTEITATVGQDELKDGDTVKEGEVIRYTVTLKNKGNETLENVQLKLDVPDGTVYVRPIPQQFDENGNLIEGTGYVYEDDYYEEITNNNQLSELTNITIPELSTTYKIEYEVRVYKGTAGKEISNKPTVIFDGVQLDKTEFNNSIEESNIRVTIKRMKDLQIRTLPGGTMEYGICVENLSNSIIKNLQMQIISDAYQILRIDEMEKIYFGDEIPQNINIGEIEPKGKIYFAVYGEIDEDIKELNTSVIVKDSDGDRYRSNLSKEVLVHVSATIKLESQQNGKNIKEGDIVEYNITARNTSEIEGSLVIEGSISDYMQIQSIKVNNVITRQCIDPNDSKTYYSVISNDIYEGSIVKPDEMLQVNIVFKVKNIPGQYHGKVINNKLTANILNSIDVTSEVISHVLMSNDANESIKNIISGYAWHDANGNGKKDADEVNLSGIDVKLFDTLTNKYLQETRINANGEYTFIKIPNGSYLVVFIYDTSKYVFTQANAEGVDTSMNSKVSLKHIDIDGQEEKVAAIELSNLRQNTFNMNIGLKDNTGDVPIEEQPSISINPNNPSETENKNTVSGYAWLDLNRNGQKDNSEESLSGIRVTIYDTVIKEYIGNTITDKDGKYTFENIEKGSYIIIFEYDTEKYEPTTYRAEGVDTTINSKVIVNKININGKEQTVAVTDTIKVQNNVSNINIGLKEKLIFDLELDKYISRIVVQNNKGTKSYDYDGKILAKAEIPKKQLQGSLVVLEYTIKVKNAGEVSGYVKNVVDYLPAGLVFSSELNKDWYLADNNLYIKSLENVELKPGEEKELKLVLTKTMTNENTGLINNRAEIHQDYNQYGVADIDSKPNNQVQDEDDFGYADVIIGISTGGSNMAYFILLMINTILIGIAIKLMIKNGIIKISKK